jgi:hypothetical protein
VTHSPELPRGRNDPGVLKVRLSDQEPWWALRPGKSVLSSCVRCEDVPLLPSAHDARVLLLPLLDFIPDFNMVFTSDLDITSGGRLNTRFCGLTGDQITGAGWSWIPKCSARCANPPVTVREWLHRYGRRLAGRDHPLTRMARPANHWPGEQAFLPRPRAEPGYRLCRLQLRDELGRPGLRACGLRQVVRGCGRHIHREPAQLPGGQSHLVTRGDRHTVLHGAPAQGFFAEC